MLKSNLIKNSFKEYCQLEYINSSSLKDFIKNPKLYYMRYIEKSLPERDEERFFIVGRAVHCMSLEPELFHKEFKVGDISKKSAVGKANHALAKNEGKSLISADEYKLCQHFAKELPLQEEWNKYEKEAINIYNEITIVLEQSGVKLKIRLDRCIELVDRVIIYDIKTSAEEDEDGFINSINRYDYILQYAFYRFVAETHFKKPVEFIFAFCSKVEPFEIGFIQMDDGSYEIGFAIIFAALKKYFKCKVTKKWFEPQKKLVKFEMNDWSGRRYHSILENFA